MTRTCPRTDQACPIPPDAKMGWCPVDDMTKYRRWVELCLQGGKYTKAYEEGRGPGQKDGKPKTYKPRDRVKSYATALARWVKAGRPVRSEAEVLHIFESICKPCNEFDGQNFGCKVCGCGEQLPAIVKVVAKLVEASLGRLGRWRLRLLRKIAMATEHCPRGKWPDDSMRPLVVVLGLHCSLSGCLAEVLQSLGVFMGMPVNHGEDRTLMRICEQMLPFPGIEKQFTREQRVVWLRKWLRSHVDLAGDRPVGAKYPHLCALASELVEAWPSLKVIHVSRRLDESVASLIDREKHRPSGVDPSKLLVVQEMLHEAKHRFLERHPHLTVAAQDLLVDPAQEVQRLVDYLGIRPTGEQRREAIAGIQPDLSKHSPPRPSQRWTDDTTVLVKTFERPEATSRLLTSLYRYYPAARVIVGDDSKRPGRWETAETVHFPYDCGLGQGRNLLVQHATTPYILLCDDDFVFIDKTDVQALYDELLASSFHVMGGAVKTTGKKRLPFRGHFVQDDDTLTFRPGLAGNERGRPYYHVTENFFLARREALLRAPWDDRLKVGEHIDWAIRAWQVGIRIGRVEAVEVLDEPIEASAVYKRARNRVGQLRRIGLQSWAERLGFSHFVCELFPNSNDYNLLDTKI